jgi:hypothetical protein
MASTKELETIKNIRNQFAHSFLIQDFNSDSVRQLANNLKIFAKLKVTITPEDDEAAAIRMFEEPPKSPRERFIRSCQVILLYLTMSKRSHPAPPEPQF